ncbi:hypothetical protein P7K49_032876 [Saguinus oedipus]|uniref:LTD domain-containing protein n=1 Tax=Saguinus oedipus TaxID=9490 RepID=A0ABQ9TQA8_SAGOE|nr:hypothetical protein P7K49_032876 [Saguinus oedipus]
MAGERDKGRGCWEWGGAVWCSHRQAHPPCLPYRLKLSPSPSSRITVSRATLSGSGSSSSTPATGRLGRSKRKRLEVEEPLGSGPSVLGTGGGGGSFHLAQQASASGSVSIEEIDLEGKFVQLKNNSDKDQSLGNWRIKRQILEGEEIAYKFTPKYVLRAGQMVTEGKSGHGQGVRWSPRGWRCGTRQGVGMAVAAGAILEELLQSRNLPVPEWPHWASLTLSSVPRV